MNKTKSGQLHEVKKGWAGFNVIYNQYKFFFYPECYLTGTGLKKLQPVPEAGGR